MSEVDLYIIAAGKGSRMNSSMPKALVPITGEPCLTTTLQQIGSKFRKVFVVTNELAQQPWDRYFEDLNTNYPELTTNLQNVPIVSGFGDGDAVKSALHKAAHLEKDRLLAQEVVIVWGDVFFPQAEIIDELLAIPMDCSGLIPATIEVEPYVQLETVPQGDDVDGTYLTVCSAAKFSKHGELVTTSGFHDQSVFRFKMRSLYRALAALQAATWKGNHYITPGNELSLLHTFHYLYNTMDAARVYRTKYPTLSFNTVEEVYNIQTEIDLKWKHKFRVHS